jgi:uncharacterized protein GlcG (DUF336 family)
MELEVPSTTLSWEAGHTAVAAAVAHAQRLGVRINAAVCDASGLLVAFLRMPLSFPQSIELAIDKARTAAGFGFPTSKWMAEYRSTMAAVSLAVSVSQAPPLPRTRNAPALLWLLWVCRRTFEEMRSGEERRRRWRR